MNGEERSQGTTVCTRDEEGRVHRGGGRGTTHGRRAGAGCE